MEKLHQEFGEKLLVLGANGYDDSNEKIKEFTADQGLTFPMLPEASQIANEQFFVTGYPTTFWIDANGKILKRMTGFDEESFSEMKTELKRLIDSQ